MHTSLNIADCGPQADQAAFVAALDQAHARSFHSYFTQYILTDDQVGYVTIDEGDYRHHPESARCTLPLLERVQ